MRFLSFLVTLALTASFATCLRADEPVKPESLGQPMRERFATQIYARNVWDLQIFENRLYVGTGNSSNGGPDSNAGPVPVWSLDLQTGAWKNEFTVDDEQIDVFRVLDKTLTIPGHDPRDDWSKGNFYQLRPDGWKKTRTIPNGIHNYDMAWFGDRMWAALGTQGRFQLVSSGDAGQNWRTYDMPVGRTYTLSPFEGLLFGWGMVAPPQAVKQSEAIKDEKVRRENLERLGWPAYQVTSGETLTPRPDLTRDILFPGAPGDSWAKLVRPVEFRNQLLYIGGTVHNDHQTDPFGVYAAASLRVGKVQTRHIELGADEKPWDIVVQSDTAHILTSRKITPNATPGNEKPDEFQISVWSSKDAKTWQRTIQFTQPTFARSFACDGTNWYFGLGTDVGAGWEKQGLSSYTRDLRPEAGVILRAPLGMVK